MMINITKLKATILCAIIITAILIGFYSTMPKVKVKVPIEKKIAKWTCIFYLDADNDLDEYKMMDIPFEGLKKVGSNKNLNLIALYDGNGTNDTALYYIEEGKLTNISLSLVNGNWTDELNMGDEKTLSSLIVWSALNYPAEHYNVMLVDHGGSAMGICWDDNSKDHLSLVDLKNAFNEFKVVIGKKIDVVSTEACLMAGIEVHYQLREVVDYFVGSEAYMWGGENITGVPIPGNWRYDIVWSALANNTDMSPEELSILMVKEFVPMGPFRYPPFIPKKEYSDTFSAVNLSRIENVVNATNALASFLLDKLTGIGRFMNREAIEKAIFNTESFSGQFDFAGLAYLTFYDLYDFADEIEKSILIKSSEYSKKVKDGIKNSIVAERHNEDKNAHPDANGISVFLPIRRDEYFDEYETTDFAKETKWDEFFKELWFGL